MDSSLRPDSLQRSAESPATTGTSPTAHEALALQASAIRRLAVLATLPLLTWLLATAAYPAVSAAAITSQPHPALAVGLIGQLALACSLMLQQLWQLHQESRRWCHLPILHGSGLPQAGEMLHKDQSLSGATNGPLATRLSRLAEHHDQRLRVSALMAGLTVGLGLVVTLYGLFNALGEMPLPSDQVPSSSGLGAALAAAVFTALAAFCLGALLLAVSSASNRLKHMRLTSTRGWLQQNTASRAGTRAPEPPAPLERPAISHMEQSVLELVQSVRRLSADLDNQTRTTSQLLARMEALPEQAPSGHVSQSLSSRSNNPLQAVHTPRTEAQDPQADARQRINKLQHLLGELQVSNEYILANLATSSRTPPTHLG
jgi:hypothetical protein